MNPLIPLFTTLSIIFIVLSIVFVSLHSKSQTQTSDSPGINVYFKSELVEKDFTNLIINAFEKLPQIEIPDITRKLQDKQRHLKAYMNIQNIKFSDIKLNKQNSGIYMGEQQSFKFQLVDLSLALDYDYFFMQYQPQFQKRIGHSRLVLDKFNLNFEAYLNLEDDRLRMRLTEFNITFDKDVIQWDDESGVIQRLYLLIIQQPDNFKTQLFQNAINEILDHLMFSYIHVFKGLPIKFDYTIVKKPILSKNGLGINLRGMFQISNKQTVSINPIQTMPLSNPNGKNLQIFISEFSFNSFFDSLFQLGLLQSTITKDKVSHTSFINMTTEWMKQFIPRFAIYKSNREMRLLIKASEAPKMQFKNGYSTIFYPIQIDMQVLNEDETSFESALLLELDMLIYIDLNVNKKKLKMRLNQIDIDVTSTQSNVFVDFKTTDLQTIIQFVKINLISVLNSMLQQGVSLPLSQGIDVKDIEIIQKEGYLEFQAVPIFEFRLMNEYAGLYYRNLLIE